MKKFNLILLALLCVNSFVVCSQEIGNKYDDVSKLIDVWLAYEKDYQDIPFISGVAVSDQKILWSGAFGHANVEDSVLGNENTMSSICSISKVFTATAIMALVDEGKINLDDKVKDILPKYSITQNFPEGGSITVRSLLSHTSGLPRDTNHGYWGGPDHTFPTKNELFESLSSQQTERPVGTEVSYSNVGYALLGQIIEKVTGDTFKNHLESSLFKPLNMSNSTVEMQSSHYGNKHAIGYTAVNRYGKRNRANFYQSKALQPAMGISSTALDLAKFAMWQFRLAGSSKTEIMKPSSLKSMYKSQGTAKDEHDRGFGYVVYTDKKGSDWAIHGGVCPGYVSFLKMDVTNKKAYAFLVSANRGNPYKYVNRLVGLLERADQIEPMEQKENSELDLSQYEGFFNVNPWNSDYYVAKWGNDLVSLHFPVESLKYSMRQYKHIEGDNFQLVESGELLDETIHFSRDEQGKVLTINNMGNDHYRTSYPKK
ncbi:MAG: beta-lactamase family protein [Colwellia sp.]|nr:beta-lactamase family protein [Colwellia sp.]